MLIEFWVLFLDLPKIFLTLKIRGLQAQGLLGVCVWQFLLGVLPLHSISPHERMACEFVFYD